MHRPLLPAMTTTNTATLQQQLDDAKAQLVQLQMQAGEVPVGDTGATTQPAQPVVTVSPSAPAMTLSAADISEMDSALTALANLLVTVQTKAAQDPRSSSPRMVLWLPGSAGYRPDDRLDRN